MTGFKYISIYRILSKLERDYGIKDLSESDIIEWIGEALEAIGVVNQYEEAVAFIEIGEHQCFLPVGFHSIIQIARNNQWSKTAALTSGLCPNNVIIAATPDPVDTNDGTTTLCPVALDCHGTPIEQYDVAYYRPYYDLQWEYSGWCNSSIYQSLFSPVRPASHSFFNSIICTETNQDQIYAGCNDEYSIIGGEVLRFSFKEGQIGLSYLRQKLDEDGYPMIPDLKEVVEACTNYVMHRITKKAFFQQREGSKTVMDKFESDWHWYCRQAGNKLIGLYGVDDFEDLANQQNYLIPRRNEYSSFFSGLNKAENRQFMDPNGRNYFRGYYE